MSELLETTEITARIKMSLDQIAPFPSDCGYLLWEDLAQARTLWWPSGKRSRMFRAEIRIKLDDHKYMQRPIQVEELKRPEVSFRMLDSIRNLRIPNPCPEWTC
jgi:hypothetical protein